MCKTIILLSLCAPLLLAPTTLLAQSDGSGLDDVVLDEEEASELDLGSLLDFTVESASRQKEPLREAPVPTSVITSEMIRAIGARNLRDVLTAYVPGMTVAVDHNEYNVAMRGIYASSQQKILIMVDGRRLNQRAYLAAAPGFGISINPDKVAQIEVLRGPGSSVYGNVALTAVVNIITKSGDDIDGIRTRVGIGNYGQVKTDVAVGRQFSADNDLVMYGSLYRSSGEKFAVGPNETFLGDLTTETSAGGIVPIEAVTGPVNYDVGLRYRLHDFKIVAQTRFDKHTEPFSSAGRTGDLYNGDNLRTFRGLQPGLGMRSTNIAVGWERQLLGNLTLSADVGYDRSSIESVLATSPNDTAIYLAWHEHAYYGIAQARYDYDIEGLGSGNVLVGAHVDWWRLSDSTLLSGGMGEFENVADRDNARVLLRGSEASISGFVQVKQRLLDWFIVNAGGRFDFKTRRNNTGIPMEEDPETDDVAVFSPRAAVIFTPTDIFDLKLSYADAFVDSPYWYRYNSLATYAGAYNLRPEKLRSIQLTPSVRLLQGALQSTVNLSYNGLRDGIYRVPDAVVGSGDPFYTNAGKLNSFTIELETRFIGDWYRVHANYTWFRVLSVEEYTAFDLNSPRAVVNQGESKGRVWNVPEFYGNLNASLNPVRPFAPDNVLSNLWVDLRLQHIGSRQSPITRVSINRPDPTANILNVEGDVLLVHAGLRVQDLYFEGLGLSLHVNNLFGTRWYQGGSTSFPYPQAGRWLLAQLEFVIDP